MLTPNSRARAQLPPDRRKPVTSYARAVGSYVPKLAAKAFEKYGFHSAEIMTSWRTIAGDELASATAPERLKWPRQAVSGTEDGRSAGGATLVLRVEAAKALEIEYRSGEIIDRINRYFGYRAVAKLTVVQAQLTPKAPASAALPTFNAAPPSDMLHPDTALGAALTALWLNVASSPQRR